MRYLGCYVRSSDDGISIEIPPEKIQTITDLIRERTDFRFLSPNLAGTLAGKLGWGGQNVFSKSARAFLRPLHWHQHKGRSGPMTRRLKYTPQWWLEFLATASSRFVPGDLN